MLAIVLEVLQMLVAARAWQALLSVAIATAIFSIGKMAGLTSDNNVLNAGVLTAIACGTYIISWSIRLRDPSA